MPGVRVWSRIILSLTPLLFSRLGIPFADEEPHNVSTQGAMRMGSDETAYTAGCGLNALFGIRLIETPVAPVVRARFRMSEYVFGGHGRIASTRRP